MKRVISIDGGGAKGIIPLTVIAEIEARTGKRFSEIFDLAIGSSVGSIVTGILSSTDLKAEEFLDIMKDVLPKIFKWRLRMPIFQPKYSRKELTEVLYEYIGPKTMSECVLKYICTSVNMVDGQNHYFKSWEEKDGKELLVEAITRSYAAPLYFGKVVDKKNNAVWLDGGTGNNSNPLQEAYIEILRQGWDKEEVHILSLGCGQRDYSIPFDKAQKYENVREVWYYGNMIEGGLARTQSSRTQTAWLNHIAQGNNNITFQRIEDYNLPAKMDGMDKVKYLDDYEAVGHELAKYINYDLLI